jgi:hypothetical protein
MDNRIPEQGMTLNDLVRLGAELALGVEPVDVGPRIMETPIYTGRLLALEVQPGLMLSASDVTYASNQNFAVEMEPALVCGIMLSGGTAASYAIRSRYLLWASTPRFAIRLRSGRARISPPPASCCGLPSSSGLPMALPTTA